MEDDIAPEEADVSEAGGLSGDFGTRLLWGVLFAVIAIGLAYAGQLAFALLVLPVTVVMSWEWARVVRGTEFDLTLVVHAVVVAVGAILTAFGYAALGLAALVIGAIIVLPLQFGERPLVSAAGVVYTGLPAVALLWLRGNEPMGFLAVLFIFLVVWTVDTAAFLAGRLIGGPRLAPRISPKKTWAGLAGGVIASVIAGAMFGYFAGLSPSVLAVSGFVMGLIAQGGDLGESALKRAYGVKDASNLIPGHGGLMDRTDGLVAVAVAAALIALFVDAHAPAEALFARFWE
ncbi:MAG TPA: phosphatidate cytidylyltransferase [Hyphomicrobiaceae bacterium]|nr:phosphatidate cytidylyltransferase [Hyphomicrobiaceae bacterium]